MSVELNIKDKLSFEGPDLVAPEIVVKEFADQLESATNGLVKGIIEPYNGPIQSYETERLNIFGPIQTETHDIQEDLGAIGYNYSKFEFNLVATSLPHYRYRVLFFGYSIGGYPVKVVLEESVAAAINDRGYIYNIKNREELEKLMIRALSSSKIIGVIQELINATRIEQTRTRDAAQKEEDAEDS